MVNVDDYKNLHNLKLNSISIKSILKLNMTYKYLFLYFTNNIYNEC